MDTTHIKLWQRSDWNGFFGLFTNNVTNILVFTGLLLYALDFPEDMVLGRILPGLGLAVCLCSLWYGWAGYRIARREGRQTVTALPSGISVPHMFLIVFMIMLPVKLATGDAMLAWKAGIAWGFIEGLIECLGAAVGPWVRRKIPRAALLGSLAGASLTYIAANAALQAWETAYIAFACFSVIMLGWVARKKMPFNLPAGLCALVLGTALGWLSGHMQAAPLVESFASLDFYIPLLAAGDVFEGFSAAAPYILVAIPMGIYNFMETIDNLESASVAGDKYNTSEIMVVDGVTSMIGACFGNPVPTAVYIGHPGWKAVGARLGYSVANGLCVLVMILLGIVPLMLRIIPLAALLPILIYIGIVITTQAFAHVPKSHFPAVVVAILPWMADWGRNLVNGGAAAAGAAAATLPIEALASQGVHYGGMNTLAQGSIVIGIVWAALLVFMVERRENAVVATALAAAALSFFGVIHSPSVGVFQANGPMIGYLIAAGVALAMRRAGYQDDDEPGELTV